MRDVSKLSAETLGMLVDLEDRLDEVGGQAAAELNEIVAEAAIELIRRMSEASGMKIVITHRTETQ